MNDYKTPNPNRPVRPNSSAPVTGGARPPVPVQTPPTRQAPTRRKGEERSLSARVRNFVRYGKEQYISPVDVIRIRGGVDRPLMLVIIVMVCFGLVMVFSSSYPTALSRFSDSYFIIGRQLLWVIVGGAAMLLMSMVDYRLLRRLAVPIFIVCGVLLLVVLVMGTARGSAQRWIQIGPITLQPSEWMKLGLVLFLAKYYEKYVSLTNNRDYKTSLIFGTFIPAGIVLGVCLLVALEHHFSGTIIMFVVGAIILWVAGCKKLPIFAVGIGGAVVVGGAIMFTDYAKTRVDSWLHPENYSTQGEIWQTYQGVNAIGSGGLFGRGLGNSLQKHGFVAEPYNDFIFSIIGEELGLIGCLAVVALFTYFVWRGVKIALNAPDTFASLVMIGIVGKVGMQALLNIGVVTGTIPNTGISLPFISSGGSSLTILMAEMGILLSISRYSYQRK